MQCNATQRNATQRNATQRNATQRNATQRNATQRNAMQCNAINKIKCSQKEKKSKIMQQALKNFNECQLVIHCSNSE